jgi:hypothetical protein
VPDLNNDQFETVYHSSYDKTPPHMMDIHPNIMSDTAFAGKSREELPDWANREADAFFAGTVTSAADRAQTGRPFMHRYRVPRSAMSAELYGDDHMYAIDAFISENPEKSKSDRALADRTRAKSLYAKSDQPELWQTTPVSKQEAVGRGTVLRYRNMYEDAGNDSMLIPKSAMRDRGVEFLGTDEITKDNLLHDYETAQSQSKRAAQVRQDPKLAQSIADEAEERKNRMEESRNRRNQLTLFDMPIDASNVSVLD